MDTKHSFSAPSLTMGIPHLNNYIRLHYFLIIILHSRHSHVVSGSLAHKEKQSAPLQVIGCIWLDSNPGPSDCAADLMTRPSQRLYLIVHLCKDVYRLKTELTSCKY